MKPKQEFKKKKQTNTKLAGAKRNKKEQNVQVQQSA